jgi:hypothetical protein
MVPPLDLDRLRAFQEAEEQAMKNRQLTLQAAAVAEEHVVKAKSIVLAPTISSARYLN